MSDGATALAVLANARVVTPGGVIENGWVSVADGRIAAVGASDAPSDARTVDLDGAWLLPGFVDLHMHGGGGHDVTASPDAMAGAVAFHRAHGTTNTLISLVTAPVEQLREQVTWAAALTSTTGGVLGAHLEGPFLSHARCGAQNAAHLRLPDRDAFADLLAAADGTLRSMTIAPELPGALELVADVVAAGTVAALGHSDATYAQARAAIDAGASLCTHLFNGMRPLHHREPGLVGAALESGIACELINDGVHVHPAVTSLLGARPEQLVLVTDAIDAAGVGDGQYLLGGQAVRVQDGQARLASTGSLAGSTLTMAEAVRRAVLDSGLPIEVASAAASGNPARVLGLQDRVGAISPGRTADFAVLDEQLQVRAVMAAGVWQGTSPAAPRDALQTVTNTGLDQ
ncbi:MAG TPA: N-acetylglucosamine-6-phosphate deacetylase [Jatrophihabitantaceae bacterium]|nr:N-acetylglucosamine-6-phosphate deacetylase [Jatrophihabitantaceae bacterium]